MAAVTDIYKKDPKKEAVKKALVAEFDDFIKGNKTMQVLTRDRHRVILRPKANIVRDGYSFNLRATAMFDTPFVDDQDSSGLDGIKVKSIIIEDGINLTEAERCTAMFLYFHPSRDLLFTIIDNVKEANQQTALRALRTQSYKAWLDNYEDEATIFGVYASMRSASPYVGRSKDYVYNAVLKDVNDNPQAFIDAVKDKKNSIRLTYYKGVASGTLSVKGKELHFGDGGAILIQEDMYATMSDAFCDYALSKAGVVTYEAIVKKLLDVKL